MNILMNKSWEAPEYLDDGLLHGLRRLFGNSVVDYPRMWHMYADSFGPGKRDLTKVVGRGYTLYATLEDKDIDRSDLEAKIRTGFFDLIIMHSWYPVHNLDFILEHTPRHKIVWIDGRDEREILHTYVGLGHYFKRELIQPTSGVLPISFGFPREKIRTPVAKTRAVAHCVAGDTSTYIFDTEDSYYQQYNEALFGITRCKGGWDCMRHYEIMGARSVPWFVDLEGCPQTTCTTLPRAELMQVKQLIAEHGLEDIPVAQYEDLRHRIYQHFEAHCTTEELAKYVITNTTNSGVTYSMPSTVPLRTSQDLPGLCIPWDHRVDDPNNPDIETLYARSCSTPSDIVEHIPYMNQLAQNCNHITELGVRFGTSSTAWMRSNAILRSYDLFVQPEARALFDAVKRGGKDVILYEQNSLQPSYMEPTDLLFIDTWHSYQQVRDELALWAPLVRKYIVFHDTSNYAYEDENIDPPVTPGPIKGIWPAIEEFMSRNPSWRFRVRFYYNNGVTVIERATA
jgi:hypothetical protein